MGVAGIVLCGGASQRMGQPKAWLSFAGEPLLNRVVRIVQVTTSPVIVVAGPNQSLPELPADVSIARDAIEHQGPLVGLSAGLSLLPTDSTHIFVTGCDVPFLTTDLIRLFRARAQPGRALVAVIAGERQPLPALYPASIATHMLSLLGNGERSMRGLWKVIPIEDLSEEEIRTVDPTLEIFAPLNEPHDYEQAADVMSRGLSNDPSNQDD